MNYTETDIVPHSSNNEEDVMIQIDWSAIEKLLQREIPYESKKEFIQQHGSQYIKISEVANQWKRISSVWNIALGTHDVMSHNVSAGTGVVKWYSIFIITIMIFTLIEKFYKQQMVTKFFKAPDQNGTLVTESVVDPIINSLKNLKEPTKEALNNVGTITITAIKKVSLPILNMLRTIWDYFFGEKDIVFTDITIRRRRQLLLFGIIVALMLLHWYFSLPSYVTHLGVIGLSYKFLAMNKDKNETNPKPQRP